MSQTNLRSYQAYSAISPLPSVKRASRFGSVSQAQSIQTEKAPPTQSVQDFLLKFLKAFQQLLKRVFKLDFSFTISPSQKPPTQAPTEDVFRDYLPWVPSQSEMVWHSLSPHLERLKENHDKDWPDVHFFTPEEAASVVRILTNQDVSQANLTVMDVQAALNHAFEYTAVPDESVRKALKILSDHAGGHDIEKSMATRDANRQANAQKIEAEHQAILTAIQANDAEQLLKALLNSTAGTALLHDRPDIKMAVTRSTFQKAVQSLIAIPDAEINLNTIAPLCPGDRPPSGNNLAFYLKLSDLGKPAPTGYYLDLDTIVNRYMQEVDMTGIPEAASLATMPAYQAAMRQRAVEQMCKDFNRMTGLKVSTMNLSSPLRGPQELSPDKTIGREDALKILWVKTLMHLTPNSMI